MSQNYSEIKVFNALNQLPAPWRFFPSVEWRALGRDGEVIGEADVVVFHPQHGLVVFEIKGGAIHIKEGKWFYQSGLEMKQSPFSQARRNRYALMDKLTPKLGKSVLERLSITHAVWFPDVVWKGGLPTTEAPSLRFLLDNSAIKTPEKALLALFHEVSKEPEAWQKQHQQALFDLLAPTQHQIVPLSVTVDQVSQQMAEATDQQLAILRLLRSQKRLLIDGSAGTGKTLLAVTLAKEHAEQGKRVLLTCYNHNLAQHLSKQLQAFTNITVLPFHELAKYVCKQAGVPYLPPSDPATLGRFYQEESPELLLTASEQSDIRFDSIIVDEAADFAQTWWIALEGLGAEDFSWYCFYDQQQTIYQQDWQPPFTHIPMQLDVNLRNTQAISRYAHQLANYSNPDKHAPNIPKGESPLCQLSEDFDEMAQQLKSLLHELTQKQYIKPEQIVILSPFRHTNPQSNWTEGLKGYEINLDMHHPKTNQLRIGTIQGFKGLEADIVILAGITEKAAKNPQVLYVGASRAKVMLYVLALTKTLLGNPFLPDHYTRY